jgi:hypothetical protein
MSFFHKPMDGFLPITMYPRRPGATGWWLLLLLVVYYGCTVVKRSGSLLLRRHPTIDE